MSTGPAMVAGVDSSTQSCKIVVCELESGQIVRTGRAAHPDGTEVSAAAWLRAFEEATADPGLLEDVQALAVGWATARHGDTGRVRGVGTRRAAVERQ